MLTALFSDNMKVIYCIISGGSRFICSILYKMNSGKHDMDKRALSAFGEVDFGCTLYRKSSICTEMNQALILKLQRVTGLPPH